MEPKIRELVRPRDDASIEQFERVLQDLKDGKIVDWTMYLDYGKSYVIRGKKAKVDKAQVIGRMFLAALERAGVEFQ